LYCFFNAALEAHSGSQWETDDLVNLQIKITDTDSIRFFQEFSDVAPIISVKGSAPEISSECTAHPSEQATELIKKLSDVSDSLAVLFAAAR
jgi:hypothetical protein